jgi:beta-glucosidase-like glycosyl hydrolase
LLAQKLDVPQVQELIKEKASKNSVSTALRKKANKEEVEEQYNSLKKQFEQLRADMEDYLRTKSQNENRSNLGTDAVLGELERVTAKHTTELNRIILDMDLKPSRAEVGDIVTCV